jgi:hypothetical protein
MGDYVPAGDPGPLLTMDGPRELQLVGGFFMPPRWVVLRYFIPQPFRCRVVVNHKTGSRLRSEASSSLSE